jgi:hypothetical protein
MQNGCINYARAEKGAEIDNGGGGEEELVNSKNPPLSPYIPSQRRNVG